MEHPDPRPRAVALRPLVIADTYITMICSRASLLSLLLAAFKMLYKFSHALYMFGMLVQKVSPIDTLHGDKHCSMAHTYYTDNREPTATDTAAIGSHTVRTSFLIP
jgi:hypothetical protein